LTDSLNRVFERLFPRRDGPAAPDDAQRPWVIAGLGNPGAEYASTRHNVGIWCLDELARRHRVRLDKSDRRIRSARVTITGKTAYLVIPRTYVNDSGPAVRYALEKFHCDPGQLIVVLDEINLEPGEVRIRRKGSAGGHNGMKSIIASLGAEEFVRVRLGVGRPPSPERQIDHVLGELTRNERAAVDDAVRRAADAIESIVGKGVETAMNEFN
jgi:PTH1 family peptidyl-tRNA hydrolase